MNDRPIHDASLEPHIPALMNLLATFPDVNDRGQRVTVVDHEPMACEVCGDPAVVDAQWYAASGSRGWSRVCCGPCGTRRGTIDAATHLMWLTPAGDVRARQAVVRAVQAGGWTLYTRPDSTGPLFAARDHERGAEYVGVRFTQVGTLESASHGLLTKAGQEVHETATAVADATTAVLAEVLAWLGVDATADVEPVEDRPSCHGCGTTVLAAVTVHPSRGAYLVEDLVRGLRQWLTAWCDGCAENEMGDEPGWLVPEGADTATWPALAADTMAARLWVEVGVCFRCHDPAGRDSGQGDSGKGGRWRWHLRVAAMVRRLSRGLRFRVTTTAPKATEVDR